MTDNPENTRGTGHPQPRPVDEPANDTNTPQSSSQNQSGPEQTQPSLATRIQSSAAGLARSAFQGGAGDISQTLSSLSDGKSGGSSASARAGGQGYFSSRETSTGLRGSASGGHAGQAGAESFRKGGTGSTLPQGGFALPEMSAEDFQRADAYTDTDGGVMMSGAAMSSEGVHTSSRSSLDDLQGQTGSWKGKARAHDPVQLEYNTAWERAEHLSGQQPASAQPVSTDGAAVVSLLSDASFDPNFDPAADEIDLDPAAEPAPLTASEIETLESFRRQMGASGVGGEGSTQPQQQQLSGQSLIPDIDSFLQQNDPAYTQQTASSDSATALRDNVLANLPGAADWITVQERYHDEVWGYLRPVLEAARAEMEEKSGAGEGYGEDGPAVRRLKMILQHMKA